MRNWESDVRPKAPQQGLGGGNSNICSFPSLFKGNDGLKPPTRGCFKKCPTGIDWFDFGDFASRPGVKHLLEADLAWLLRSPGLLWNSYCHMKLQE